MSLPYSKIVAAAAMSALLKTEVNPEISRATATLLAGVGGSRHLKMGQPIGRIIENGATTVTVSVGTNTGNGLLTLAAPAFTNAAKPGRYTVTMLTEKANGGEFEVEGPDGAIVGAGKVGTAFGKQVKFTIADGAVDFVPGDQFYLTVGVVPGEDDGKVVAWDPNATDGSQVICGFCLKDCSAAEGEDLADGVLYARRLAVLYPGAIIWPEGLSAVDAARALADVDERLGLIARA